MVRLGFRNNGTPHGHRSSFSTHFNRKQANSDVIERCLAHVHGDKSREAYNRYEYLEERRLMLRDWANNLDQVRLEGHAAVAAAAA
jgi:integrase